MEVKVTFHFKCSTLKSLYKNICNFSDGEDRNFNYLKIRGMFMFSLDVI